MQYLKKLYSNIQIELNFKNVKNKCELGCSSIDLI